MAICTIPIGTRLGIRAPRFSASARLVVDGERDRSIESAGQLLEQEQGGGCSIR